MRKFPLLLSILILFGCGGNGDGLFSQVSTSKFQIADTTWEVSLPGDWEKLPLPEKAEVIFLARRGTENFVILRKKGYSKEVIAERFKKAGEHFTFFQEESFSHEKWKFRAKETPSASLREFIQKPSPIPGTDFFLVGSCSWEVNTQTSSSCDSIIDSWKISVDKEAEEK